MTLTQITEKGIKDGEIVNADINASAAIAKSKLASLDIVNGDINASAAIAKSKLASLDIVNADVNSSAAIAKEKLEDFVTGNSNNRLLTASGNTNSLIGESSFTYNGNGGLDMEGTGSAFIQIKTPDDTDGGVYFRTGTTNAGAVSYLHNSTLTDGVMSFRSGGTTKLTLKGNGNLGLGITSPAFKLESNGGSDDSVCFAGRSDGGNGNNARFTFKGYAHGGGANYGGGLKIQTRDTVNVFHDRLTIDSSGKVGIGYTTPSSQCEIVESHDSSGSGTHTKVLKLSTTAYGTGQGPKLEFGTTNSTYNTWIYGDMCSEYEGGSFGGAILFRTNSGSGATSVGERFRIKRDGNVNIKDGDLQVYGTDNGIIGLGVDNATYGKVNITVAGADASGSNNVATFERPSGSSGIHLKFPTGGGVEFNAYGTGTNIDSNLLDDYEEGTFTPTLIYQNTSGLTLATNSAAGKYTKIGNICYVVGYMNWSVTGSPINDNVGFGGLPFSTATGQITAGSTRFIWNVTLGNTSAQNVTHQMFPYGTNACALGLESEQGNRSNEIGANANMTARWQGWYFTE